jgi:UDP-N-acetylmuramoylalanine--D-glutamate ligase
MKLELNNKQVLVLGLGDTGLSALRWLARQGAQLSAADTRSDPPGLAAVKQEFPDLALHLGAFRSEVLNTVDLIVSSPGVPLANPTIQSAIKRGIRVVGDVELFAQYKPAQAKVIAITGSNGKSTVTTLVGAMCEKAGLRTIVAGNIGLPVLDTLSMDTPDVYVLELSSFQLETTQLAADAATVLNVTEDHLDRYPGMVEYATAKARIFHGNSVQVLNLDDAWSLGMAHPDRKQLYFGLGKPERKDDFGLLQHENETWLAQGKKPLLKLSAMRISGLHNAANALAALALCRAIGLEFEPLLDTLREFKGLPHRVEWIADINGVAFFDDSKGTNVGATCAAIAGLPQKVVLIAGGEGKGQDFSPLQEAVKQNARAVVLIGRDAPLLQDILQPTGVPILSADSMQAAVEQAFARAQPGDAVLLSPACASFDMFRNYVHRAEVFIAAVRQLEQGAAT